MPTPGVQVVTPAQKAAAARKNPYSSTPPAGVKTPPGMTWYKGAFRPIVTPGKAPTKNDGGLAALAASRRAYDKKNPSGSSKFANWLAGTGAKAPTADSGYDPFKAYPDAPELTAYPTTDPSTIPDGSTVAPGKAHTFVQGNARLLDPQAQARQAQAAYDPTIDAINKRSAGLRAGVAGANSMLDQGFQGAADASLRGAQTVREGNATANQGLTALAARLAQVAGGDPLAAAAVGTQTADQQAANTRFANVAEQTQADQAAAANRDLALAKLGYKSSTDSAISDLSLKAGESATAGRQDARKAIMDSLGFNSDQQTAQTGRDVAKQEAYIAGQIAGPQVEAAKLANIATRQGLKITKDNVAKNDWSAFTSAKRQSYLDKVTAVTDKATAAKMVQELKKGNTPAAELALADPQAYNAIASDLDQVFRSKTGPVANPGVTFTQAIDQLKRQYPTSAPKAIYALAQKYAAGQMVAWNSQHDKGQQASKHTWKLVNGKPALVPM